MKILAHRRNDFNCNDPIPYDGIEVDVWATYKDLELGHDPNRTQGSLRYVLPCFTTKTIAINAKSSGLDHYLSDIISASDIANKTFNYFIFDAAVPESLKLLSKGYTVFTRVSEYETPAFYEEADGIWMDQMQYDWVDKEAVLEYLSDDKEVCIVSPELHGRPYKAFWKSLKEYSHFDIYLCTKYPESAKLFFNE